MKRITTVLLFLISLQALNAQCDSLVRYENRTGIKVWAYSGPGGYINGAHVVIHDAKGNRVGSGLTGDGGTVTVRPKGKPSLNLPLSVKVYGGKLNGSKFHGILRTLIEDPNSEAIVYVDHLTTAATALPANQNFSERLQAVRNVFGIRPSAPMDIVRVTNKYIDQELFSQEIKKSGGHKSYIAKIISNAKKEGRITEVKRLNTFEARAVTGLKTRSSDVGDAAKSRGLGARAAGSSTFPICNVPLGNGTAAGSNSTGSDQIIEDVGVIGLSILMKAAGLPSAVNNLVSGMLLGSINGAPTNTNGPVIQAIQAVQQQLGCIQSQIGYLSDEVTQLAFQVSLAPALSCQAQINTAWSNYVYAVQNAGNEPLNASNTSLTNVWLPQWGQINSNCGSAINDAMFGSAGGQASAWQQFNGIMQNQYPWYTFAQAQQQQTFLSYWSTLVYQQSILTSEYNSYYGYNEANQAAFGLAYSNGSPTACTYGPSSSSNCACSVASSNFCTYFSNFNNAFPPDVYSDEIALYTSGLTISAYPGGLVTSAQNLTPTTVVSGSLGATGFSASNVVSLLYNNNTFEYCQGQLSLCPASPYSYPFLSYANAAIQQYNAYQINPNSLASAVETYNNPQAFKTLAPVTWQVGTPFEQKFPGGLNLSNTLGNILASEEGLSWITTSVPSSLSTAAYLPSDAALSVAYSYNISNLGAPGSLEGTFSVPSNYFNNTASFPPLISYQCSGQGQVFYFPQTPGPCAAGGSIHYSAGYNMTISFLLGRNWWPQSMNAASYVPPPPPTL